MSRFFDELGERLRSSTAEQHAPVPRAERSPRARRRRWARRRPLIAMVVAAGGLAVPAVAAVTDVWHPDVEPAPPMRTVMATPGPAISCESESPLRLDAGPPVGDQFTSVLAVLGQPQTSADAFDQRYLPPRLIGVDLASIHYVGAAADGKRTFVVAARGMATAVPPRCLKKLAPRDRAQFPHTDHRAPLICTVGGGGGCTSLAQFREHGIFGSEGVENGRANVEGVVPDGVQAVRVTYGRSTRSFPVAGNFISFKVAVDVPQAATPDRLEWEMEDGSVRDVTP